MNNFRVLLNIFLLTGIVAADTGFTQTREAISDSTVFTGSTLRLITLNLAHGRKDGWNQLLQSRKKIRNNLDDIIALLNRIKPDIVALQEADAISWWSGSFDHVELLAEQCHFPALAHGRHANSGLFSYGTALLSRKPFAETLVHHFAPSPPTLNKGFTLGQIVWQPNLNIDKPMRVDIISVHLDFSRDSVRKTQTAELLAVLGKRSNPAIILGDLNSDWFSDDQLVRSLIEKSAFRAYRPAAKNLASYPSSNRRLDWILVSSEFEFIDYKVLPDVVSDHLAISAVIRFKDDYALKLTL